MARGVLFRWGMHPVMFGVKQLYLQVLGRERGLLDGQFMSRAPVTPARFTILKTLGTYAEGLPRWKLVQMLGVSGPVVSRMLKALEALGLLTRTRYEDDRRMVHVRITGAGAGLVDELDYLEAYADDALRDALVTRPGSGYALPDEQLPAEEEEKVTSKATYELQILERFLLRGRKRLGSTTPFTHPWHRGECSSGLRLVEPLGTFDPPAPAENWDVRYDTPWSPHFRPDVH